MISYSQDLTTTWVNVVSSVDYILQNKGFDSLLVAATTSSTVAPVNTLVAIELGRNEILTHTILPGHIWVRALRGSTNISYSK